MAAKRILVVDDDRPILEMVRDFLNHEYDVITAENGHDGLTEAMVEEHKIDLVITDLSMPGLDGIELMESLPEGTPVIVISAFLDSPKFAHDIEQVKPAAVLRKPFRFESLAKAVHEALDE